MAEKIITAGDSFSAQYYGFWTQVFNSRPAGTTWEHDPRVAGNTETATSPAVSGSVLSDLYYGDYRNLNATFTNRIGQYCTSLTRLYVMIGVNDIRFAASNFTVPATGAMLDLDGWRANLASLATKVNALGASKPARVVLVGMPYVTGNGIARATIPPWMRQSWELGRAWFDEAIRQQCALSGWLYVSLAGMGPDHLVDTLHPSAAAQGATMAGQDFIAQKIIAAGN